jgi:molybdenum cofactor biosynthesis enzyme MoaA
MTDIDAAVNGTSLVKLADTLPDCGAMKLSDSLNAKIDEATVHIVGELDQLKEQIELIKGKLIADAGLVKAAVATHFMLGAEALAFRSKVASRLQELVK